MKKIKVLLLMPHAPHYREDFLRILAQEYDLTVSARPCRTQNLIEPKDRIGYSYYEQEDVKILDNLKIFILHKEPFLFYKKRFDVVISTLGVRYPLRLLLFFFNKIKKNNSRWIWYGHFFGRYKIPFLHFLITRLVNNSDGALTYTTEYSSNLINIGCKKELVCSFNNSEVSEKAINYELIPIIDKTINILYVGTYRPYKKVERLISLAKRLSFINVRLVGPGMEKLKNLLDTDKGTDESIRVEIYPPATNEDVIRHLRWSHLVAAPGHVGLLVVTAARASRPIVIDSSSMHAPEYIIAKESNQPFINWSDTNEVDSFFYNVFKGKHDLKLIGLQLSKHVKENYTVERMARIFIDKINSLYT